MDKDFDKLHEFVEIMKVSFHCMPFVGHMGSDGRDARLLLLRSLSPTRQTCRLRYRCLLIRGLEVGSAS